MRLAVNKVLVCLAFAGSILSSSATHAVIGTVDDVPASTLLLPYFEVDLNAANGDGVNTLLAIGNASSTAILAHVMLWSDLSVHVLDFNVYLTGYDVATISLRQLLIDGLSPHSASVGQDPNDTISPQGPFSQDINFASCNGRLPLPTVPDFLLEHVQNALTGQASDIFGAPKCFGLDHGDNIARGYLTVDTVNQCTLSWPGNVAGSLDYFNNAAATDQNVLYGDYFYVNPAENFAQGETLVHIESAPGTGINIVYPPGNPETSVPGEYTFYGRYVNWTASDHREPLTTSFATRYINGGAFSGGTDLVVWRDSKVNQKEFNCPVVEGVRPPWYPLGQEQIVIFDEQETPVVEEGVPFSPTPVGDLLIPFPAEAQRVQVGGDAFPVPFSFGWLYLNLNTTVVAAGANPPEDPAAAQAWVTAVMGASGRFSVGFDAIQLDNATNAAHRIIQ